MRRLMLLAVAVGVLSAPDALSWGRIGHQIVCRIAQNELQPAERRELNRLARLYKKHGVSYTSFPPSCFFPDQIKDLPAFKRYRRTHFVNVPRTAGAVDVDDSSCADSKCVIEGIAEHAGKLRTATNDVRRAEALFFLGHWIGDIHQPLHVSFADDSGGFFVPVVSDFYPDSNLHAVWDTGIIRAAMGEDLAWRDYADELHATITAQQRTQWLNSDALQWAQESYEIALRDEVDYCARTAARCRGEEHDRELTSDYQELFQDDVELRLKQAGVRLAGSIRGALFTE